MSNETRGPRPGRIPPHLQDEVEQRRERKRRRELLGPWYRRAPFVGIAAGIVMLVVGLVLGRVFAPDPVATAAEDAATALADMQQAALVWQSGGAGVPPVQIARDEVAEGDTAGATSNLAGWKQAYEQLLTRIDNAEIPPAADGVRRLAAVSVRHYLDAVETLGAAATVDGRAREILIAEVDRFRARAEGAAVSARELHAHLTGEVPQPAPSPDVPTLPQPEGAAEPETPQQPGTPPPTDATVDLSPQPTTNTS